MKSLILIVLSVWFFSCKQVLMVTGYVKNPKKEDSLSITGFTNEAAGKYNGLFVAKGPEAFKDFTVSVTDKCPAVLIFNKAGEYILSDQRCAWVNVKQLDSLERLSVGRKELALEKMLALLKPLNGSMPGNGYDYFVFYTWAMYSPKLSRKMISEVNRFAGTDTPGIFIGAINLDLQQEWE